MDGVFCKINRRNFISASAAIGLNAMTPIKSYSCLFDHRGLVDAKANLTYVYVSMDNQIRAKIKRSCTAHIARLAEQIKLRHET